MGLGGDDHLAGQSGDDLLNGGSGDDTLIGGAGADTLAGGSGKDLLLAGNPDRDVIDGGSGHDILSFALAAEGVIIQNDGRSHIQGVEELIGSDFADALTALPDIERVKGGGGDDTLTGYQATLMGGMGDDEIWGSNSHLVGGEGDDFLYGQSGSNFLYGGVGKDTLQSGSGSDTFVFGETARHGNDTVLGMTSGDTLNLMLIDADTTQGGDQAFVQVGTFDGHAGEMVIAQGSRYVQIVELDTDGDAAADITIRLDHSSGGTFVL
jgi:Ca2+-binding RTX toxin-like protein